jgi:hypothetical protein
VEAELAALTAATAARPELALTFARPLDGRWRVRDPVALRRGLGRGELSVWASPTGRGGRVSAGVGRRSGGAGGRARAPGQIEWGAEVVVEVSGPDDLSWLEMSVGGFGVTDAPRTMVRLNLYEGGAHHRTHSVKTSRIRARWRCTRGSRRRSTRSTADGATERRVGEARAEKRPAPPAGPLRLRVTLEADRVRGSWRTWGSGRSA